MDIPETLATPVTQDTGRKSTLENTEGAIKNGQSRDTGNTGYTRHRTKINVRKYRRCNQEWTIQNHWQHRVHKTKDENKRYRKPKGQSRMDNPETLVTPGTQDTGRK